MTVQPTKIDDLEDHYRLNNNQVLQHFKGRVHALFLADAEIDICLGDFQQAKKVADLIYQIVGEESDKPNS